MRLTRNFLSITDEKDMETLEAIVGSRRAANNSQNTKKVKRNVKSSLQNIQRKSSAKLKPESFPIPITYVLELRFDIKNKIEEEHAHSMECLYKKMLNIARNMSDLVEISSFTKMTEETSYYAILVKPISKNYYVSTCKFLQHFLHKALKQYVLLKIRAIGEKENEDASVKNRTIFFFGLSKKNYPASEDLLKEIPIMDVIQHFYDILSTLALKDREYKYQFSIAHIKAQLSANNQNTLSEANENSFTKISVNTSIEESKENSVNFNQSVFSESLVSWGIRKLKECFMYLFSTNK